MTQIKQESLTRLSGRGAVVLFVAFMMRLAGGVCVAEATRGEADKPWLSPYTGPARTDVDAKTIDNHIMLFDI